MEKIPPWFSTTFLVFGALIVIAIKAYQALRPVRDFYVLQRNSFDRLSEPPWRGELFATYYSSFEDYGAAKAAFDKNESYLDHLEDGENRLFAVSAKTKSDAVSVVKKGRFGTELLHSTPDVCTRTVIT